MSSNHVNHPSAKVSTSHPIHFNLVVAAHAALIEQGAILLDIRDPDEYDSPAGPSTLRIPWRELPQRISEIRASGNAVVVACATGNRTPTAASMLTIANGAPVFRLAEACVTDVEAAVRVSLQTVA